LTPWPDLIPIPLGQGFCDLMDMVEVVYNPGGDELPQADPAEDRMQRLSIKITDL